MADTLTKDKLESAQAVLALGVLVVRCLQEHELVTVFVNAEGIVELCPPGEIQLDGADEVTAIETLLSRGYEEPQIVTYLKGREARADKI